MGNKRHLAVKSDAGVTEHMENLIHPVRGYRIMLDADLARVYGVETGVLNRAARRNRKRFPPDFAFQLSKEEAAVLRCQIGISSSAGAAKTPANWGGRRYLPFAFTEHGAFMAANILRSRRAIRMSVFVVRAFVRLRQSLNAHKELASQLKELERRLSTHDQQIQAIIASIRQLMRPPPLPPRKPIGFQKEDGS